MTLFLLRVCVAVIYGGTILITVLNILALQRQVWMPYMLVLFLMSIGNSVLVSVVHIILKRFLCILNIENAELPPPLIGFYCVRKEDQVY